MLKINNEEMLSMVKENYSKKYNRLFKKFLKDNPEMVKMSREVAENISVSIDEIEGLVAKKVNQLELYPTTYFDLDEEVNTLTDRLIGEVKISLDDFIQNYQKKAIVDKIENVVFNNKEYKTLKKDVERFNRIENIIENMSDSLADQKISVSIVKGNFTNPKTKKHDERMYGTLRFKGKLVVFSMNAIDVIISDGKSSGKSRYEGTFILDEIPTNVSVLKGWEKMFKSLEKFLGLKTVKEKTVFNNFKDSVLAVMDLRTKVA